MMSVPPLSLGEIAFVSLLLLGFGLWLWALIDCLRHEPSDGNERLVWVVVIVGANVIGALLYLILRRPKRRRAAPVA